VNYEDDLIGTRFRSVFHLRQASIRTVIFLSPIFTCVGILITYVYFYTPILEHSIFTSAAGAIGVTLIFMGMVLPIACWLQERNRRLKRAKMLSK